MPQRCATETGTT